MWSPFWSILVCKIPQFMAKSYRFRQLTIRICIWKLLLGTFKKWYCLLCYDLLSWRYQSLKLKNFIKFLLSQHFFVFLSANISWTVGQIYINHIIFWKSVMRTLRCIHVNCFSKLRFVAEVSTKLQITKAALFWTI